MIKVENVTKDYTVGQTVDLATRKELENGAGSGADERELVARARALAQLEQEVFGGD